MMYLALEIIGWLIAAALLGAVAGWLMRAALRPRAALADDSTLVARLTSAEADYAAKTAAADAAVARLKADLHAATTRASALESTGGARYAELERALKSQILAAEALASERGHALDQARNMFTTAQGEWSHRAGSADSRAAEAERRAADVEAELAKMAADLELARVPDQTPALPDRSDEIEALHRERMALMAERDALLARVSAAEAEAPAPDSATEVAALTAEIDDLRTRLAAADSRAWAPARRARGLRTGDDFTAIEGLGGAMEKALKAAGIETYDALADLSEDQLNALPPATRKRFIAGGWAEKARALAAARPTAA